MDKAAAGGLRGRPNRGHFRHALAAQQVPLAHRARLSQLRETGQARPTPIKMRLESVLTPAYKRKKFAGGDMQKYKEMVAASEKRGEYDPPHWVRYVDVDIRGLWEPHQKLGLDFLTFVGYVVSEEEIQDYNEKVARIKIILPRHAIKKKDVNPMFAKFCEV